MGFKFSYLCELLSSLEYNRILKASTSSKNKNPDISTVTSWFSNHRKRIHDGETDLLALLSCLFPEKRPDRVYGLQEPSLVKIIGRCLLLGASRRQDLDGWKASGGGDLGQCVERVMKQSENLITPGNEVTIEEVDAALNGIASRCRFSGPEIRRKHAAAGVDSALGPLFLRLPSRDAKWLTRIILKNYGPVELPASWVLKNFHFLLPTLLLLQDSLGAAVRTLTSDPIKSFPPWPDQEYSKLLGNLAMKDLAPQIGTKVGRPAFYKARSIKHCCRMTENRKMALERKYDGEYCQIHIDLDRGRDCIQIFSKSGKDSTSDKRGIHNAIRQSLRIDQKDCKISKQCILEGELLVWSNAHEKILAFHKLRKHIPRAGRCIGTDNDSPPNKYENLMIMFFDILLIDDNRCLTEPYNERRKLLKETVNTLAGQAGIAEQEWIDFASPGADDRLTRAFTKGGEKRWEGLVLKGWDDPYFTIPQSSASRGHWIKLKKDYITGLGDTADFAIVGARYDAKDTHKLGEMKPLIWTSFHVGCLENKRAVINVGARPQFRVVDVLNHHNLNRRDIQTINRFGQFQSCDVDSDTAPIAIRIDQDGLRDAEVLFKTPFVVEMKGAGFDKPQNVNYFQLRFPRVLKIHSDRTFEDATAFQELQKMAENAVASPDDEELAVCHQKLMEANGKPEYIVEASSRSSTSSYRSTSASPRYQRLSPNTNLSEELLPNNYSQAETAAGIVSRQGKRKYRELGLDSSRHNATNRDMSCDGESSPVKEAKRKDYKGPNVVIFTDSSQRATSQDIVSTQESRSCLTDVVNLAIQPKTQHETHIVSSAKSTQEDLIGENTPTSGQLLEMKIDEQQSITREGTSAHDDNLSERTDAPQPQSSLRMSTTLSRQVDVTVAQEVMSSPPHISPPRDKHTLFPMLVGRFLFKQPNHPFSYVLSATPVSVTHSINYFLDSVISGWKEDSASSPRMGTQQPAIGIVYVDLSESSATDTAADIDAAGNRLAELQQQVRDVEAGHDQGGSPPSVWPEKGKIFFLHWAALSREPSDMPQTPKRWDKVAKRSFAGSVIWGYGGCRGYSISQEAEDGLHRAKKRKTSEGEDDERFFGKDIWTSLDWREVSSLRGYELGFFLA